MAGVGGARTPAERRGARAAARAAYREHELRVRRLTTAVRAVYAELDPREAALMTGGKRWLSDNDYLVRRALKQVAQDLPRGHHERLAAAPSGVKRVADLVERYLEAHAGVYRGAELERFLAVEQRDGALGQAELWALPTLLRLGALERLVQGAEETAITSLHALEREDWGALVARASVVERTLLDDPSGTYPRLDSETRSWYRREVEVVAGGCDADEAQVAAAAVERARAASVATAGVGAHVGYYLVDEGRSELERDLGCRPAPLLRFQRALRRNAGWAYPLAVAVAALAGLLPLALWSARAGTAASGAAPSGTAAALVALLCLFVPVWLVAELIVQRLVVAVLPPRRLPKLDLEDGVPDALRTLIVVPALLSDHGETERLLRQLERHYVGNPDPNLDFALLADLLDAEAEHAPGDAELLADAARALTGLRERQPNGRFHLLCRRRLFNASEGVWMGWERKRGKLEELNRWLVEGDPGTLEALGGELSDLRRYAHVITLDADTRLPPTAARRLVGALAHPLNAPRRGSTASVGREPAGSAAAHQLAAARRGGDGAPARGYTVLQPRVEMLPGEGAGTMFARWFSGSDGLDLYTRAVSDPFMDLFGEGIYAGKGAYHLRGFALSLAGVVPDNTVLSHDVLEGGAGRCALVSDIVVYEEYPRSFLAHASRQHRWMRGDWQLLPYLARRVPGALGQIPNPLSWTARWVIRQNLARSLQPAALVAALLVGWLWLPLPAGRWTLAVLLLSAAPWLLGWLTGLPRRGLAGAASRARHEASRWLVEVATLPFAAFNGLSAAVTSLVRVYLTRSKLLQWRDARRVERDARVNGGPLEWWRALSPAPVVAGATLIVLASFRPESLPAALPLLAAWLAAPELARWISRPLERQTPRLTPEETSEWLRTARRTWLYFERFVGPEDSWLPPDHFQESPRGTVAHRTSPTNIGLLLTSTFAAFDLGFVEVRGALTRLTHTFASLGRLERHRGHLLNWYDTQTLQALGPRYVSTVDSGNLLACLIALRESCLELPRRPALRRASLRGLIPALELFADAGRRIAQGEAPLTERVAALVARIEERLAGASLSATLLDELEDVELPILDAAMLDLVRATGPRAHHEDIGELGVWSGRLHSQVAEMRRERDLFLPWLAPHARWPRRLLADVPEAPTWSELRDWYRTLTDRWVASTLDEMSREAVEEELAELNAEGFDALRGEALGRLAAAAESLGELLESAEELAREAETHLQSVDLGFLYDRRRRVFRIGYRVDDGQLDEHAYDLYASEARLASFVAIALGQVPPAHWLHLARPLADVAGERTLLSWSGTMFEYLMPALFLRTPPGGLVDDAIGSAISRQRSHAAGAGLPWGVSESAFALTDAQHNYQYRAFGVPDLALSHESEGESVVAPYATLMAARFQPQAARANLQRLRLLGAEGLYGFYDAVDFSRDRASPGTDLTVVRTYMVHHHGMALISLANLLLNDRFVARFQRDVRVQAAAHLLEEGPAAGAPFDRLDAKVPLATAAAEQAGADGGRPWSPGRQAAGPCLNSLSNGSVTSVLSASGGGFTRWRELDLTRWRADPTLDAWGQRLYLQELDRGALRELSGRDAGPAAAAAVSFEPHRVVYRRDWGDISSVLAVAVAADADAELRTVTIANHTAEARELALCTFGEVALAEHGADLRHPAFGSLFIECDALQGVGGQAALLFRRRPRAEDEPPAYLGHALVPESRDGIGFEHETDRERFLGRYGDPAAPRALITGALKGSEGAPLDPAFALRARFTLGPYATRRFGIVTAAGARRRDVMTALERFGHYDRFAPAFAAAGQRAERELRRTGLSGAELETVQAVLSALLYPAARWRPERELLAASQGPQSELWTYGISGDLPLLVVRLAGPHDLDAALLMLKAHRFWRAQRLEVELALLNLADTGYQQETQVALRRALAATGAEGWLDRRGGVFVVGGLRLPSERLASLTAAATVVIDDEALRTGGRPDDGGLPPPFFATDQVAPALPTPPVAKPAGLGFDNGYGGFDAESGDYLIWIDEEPPPAPWINVLANPRFGSLVTESGAATTWAVNSGENRLTPWSNDAVCDPSGEALYLRDEETSEVWSPTPLPAHGGAPYLVRHGPGRTRFEHASRGLRQELEVFVADDAPVKLARLRVSDLHGRQRRLTATYFLEWVLGNAPDATRAHLVSQFDAGHQALLGRNRFSGSFTEQVAFLASSAPVHALTTDRTEFLGAGGRSRPAGLSRIGLSGRVDPRCDQCAALQVHLDLPAGGSQELWFVIGRGEDEAEAERLLDEWRSPERARRALDEVRAAWRARLGQLTVRTPDPAMDLMLNGWLLYQAWACRLWGRSAFYQSSGAYGFRDQLQDSLALLHAEPGLVREQLLRAAERQFEEGDVLHWWHPPGGQGVRTRISDDLAWLPFVTAEYVSATGDTAVLREKAPYLRGPELAPGEHERYDAYQHGEREGSLHQHCLRALERAMTAGRHGLPLIGAGDWNDGLDRVGEEGKGESVWLAWFLNATARAYAEVCRSLGEDAEAERMLSRAEEYRAAVEEHAWDGAWYLRAFYDDGSPLGSSANSEARIDAIAQAWSVLSGAGDAARARTALRSVEEHLLDDEGGVLKLLAPPFDEGEQEPGYIKGYLPGVRENGGQYTHGAIWVAWAHATLGDGDRAHALFSLLNPVNRALDRCAARRYRNEPYVVSADVYGVPPHVGRGGWSWYTGSAAWLQRLGVEALLGLRLVGGRLLIEPCIPREWQGFECDYRHGASLYKIVVRKPQGVSGGAASVLVDGRATEGGIDLLDDGLEHLVEVTLRGTPSPV